MSPSRSVTFLKRKGGLFKKAHELSVLCSVDVAVIIFGHNKKLYEYSSGDINETIARFQYVRTTSLRDKYGWKLTLSSMAERTNTKALRTSRIKAAETTTRMTRAERRTLGTREVHRTVTR